jgi:hypothetical protein
MTKKKTPIKHNKNFLIVLLSSAIVLLISLIYIISTNESKTHDLVEYAFEFCGTDQPKVKFSLKIPKDWKLTKNFDKAWASYDFKNKSESFNIICGEGLGGSCEPKNWAMYTLNNELHNGCYINGNGGFTLQKEGVTFFLGGRMSKEKINQIISNLKFTD